MLDKQELRLTMNEITFSKSANLYNMILGGLIALTSDQEVGKVTSNPVSETLFLGKWLKRVKKQKSYPRALTNEIDNFLHLYAVEGRSAGLANLFHQIYKEFQIVKDTDQHFEHQAKTRFELAMTELGLLDWHISLPIEHNPKIDSPYRPTQEKEIFTTKWYWDNAFDQQENLTKKLSIFVVSTPQQVIDCLYQHGFILVRGATSKDHQGNNYFQLTLFPDNKCNGEAAIPTKFLN